MFVTVSERTLQWNQRLLVAEFCTKIKSRIFQCFVCLFGGGLFNVCLHVALCCTYTEFDRIKEERILCSLFELFGQKELLQWNQRLLVAEFCTKIKRGFQVLCLFVWWWSVPCLSVCGRILHLH